MATIDELVADYLPNVIIREPETKPPCVNCKRNDAVNLTGGMRTRLAVNEFLDDGGKVHVHDPNFDCEHWACDRCGTAFGRSLAVKPCPTCGTKWHKQ